MSGNFRHAQYSQDGVQIDDPQLLVPAGEPTFGTVTASTSAGQTLKSGSGFLKSFTVLAKGTSPTLRAWDNTSASGTILIPQLSDGGPVGDFPDLEVGETYVWEEPLAFNNGLHIIIGGTGTTTIQFQVR